MSFVASLSGPIGISPSLRVALGRRHALPRRVRVLPCASEKGDSDGRVTTTTDPKAPTTGGGRFKKRDPGSAPPRPSPLGSGPAAGAVPSGIKVIPVEQRSRDAFQGVAKVDAVAEDPTTRSVKLVAGDVAALMLFAAVGRGNHGEGGGVGDVFLTALPFLLGWFAAAPLTGTFGEDARGTKVGPAAIAAAKGWAVGVPAGLMLRAIGKGALPPQAFVTVSMVATGVLLVGWRAWFANGGGSGGAGGNKKGNPLEFMDLLMGLTKRW